MFGFCALAEHIDRFAQLGKNVDFVHCQGHAAALHTRKVEQLLHNAGQPFGFPDDDAHALVEGFVVHTAALHRLCPALDGSQRRAQLVGDGGDEIIFHLFRRAQLHRHVVDGVAQLADLIVVGFFNARFEIALCNPPRGRANLLDRREDGLHKIVTRSGNKKQDHDARQDQNPYHHTDLLIRFLQRNNVPDAAHHAAGVVLDHPRDSHHLFPAGQAPGPCAISIRIGQCLLVIRHGLALIRRKPNGRCDDMPLGIEHHQLHAFLVGEILHIISRGREEVLRRTLPVIGENIGQFPCAAVDRLLNPIINIILYGIRKAENQRDDQDQYNTKAVQKPAFCNSLYHHAGFPPFLWIPL